MLDVYKKKVVSITLDLKNTLQNGTFKSDM